MQKFLLPFLFAFFQVPAINGKPVGELIGEEAVSFVRPGAISKDRAIARIHGAIRFLQQISIANRKKGFVGTANKALTEISSALRTYLSSALGVEPPETLLKLESVAINEGGGVYRPYAASSSAMYLRIISAGKVPASAVNKIVVRDLSEEGYSGGEVLTVTSKLEGLSESGIAQVRSERKRVKKRNIKRTVSLAFLGAAALYGTYSLGKRIKAALSKTYGRGDEDLQEKLLEATAYRIIDKVFDNVGSMSYDELNNMMGSILTNVTKIDTGGGPMDPKKLREILRGALKGARYAGEKNLGEFVSGFVDSTIKAARKA